MRFALILAGGSGTRLWPMSRNAKPKGLIPFIRGRSLLTLAYERLEGLVESGERFVCAGEAHREAVMRDLQGLTADCFLGEPTGRDTLSALGFGAEVIARRDPQAVIGVFPSDHLIEPADRFREIVRLGYEIAEESPRTLVTFGLAPSYPATAYGYLKLGQSFLKDSRIVAEFKEKPDRQTAERYLAAGPERFLWNSGMFVWRAATFLDCLRRYEPETYAGLSRLGEAWGCARFPDLIREVYPGLRRISVDFAVMERAARDAAVKVAALPMPLQWLDVGSWPAFAQTCSEDGAGNALAAERSLLLDTSRTLVASSEPQHLVAVLGCEDLVIVHTADATLVCRKERTEDIKKLQALVEEKFGPRYV